MIISVKKRTILIVIAIILLITGICVAISLASTNANAAPKNGKVIVIDAGHGGIDGGVTGVTTNIKESDINLAIARSLKHFLTKSGYEVIMTRSTTDGLYGMSTINRKIKDMQTRKKIINEARPDLMVSIHQNSYPRQSEKGAQVFYDKSSKESEAAATTMQNILNVNLDSTRVQHVGDYYILQCSEFMSILVECGFLSSPIDEKLLISASYQEKVAYSIFSGIQTMFFSEGDNSETDHTH